MNYYIRFFDIETLVTNVDDVIGFLASIPEIGMNEELDADVRAYLDSDVFYPKKYKVGRNSYFIIIKTTAATLEDFKQKKALHPAGNKMNMQNVPTVTRLAEERVGWYEGRIKFKRVMLVPGTGKYQYFDTDFIADVKANSGQDCYDRIVDYLKDRVDSRSQFPSAKGKNFNFQYLGKFK